MPRQDAIAKMKQILLKRRDALRRALAGDLTLLQELNRQTSGDVLDAALDSAHDEICSQIAEVESRELVNIEKALGRIREGTYGECEICSEKIPTARLQALPYATMCIGCQREAELEGSGSSGSANWGRIVDTSVADQDVNLSDIEIDVS